MKWKEKKKVLRFGSFRVIKNWKSELIVIILRIQLRKIDIFSGFKINKIQIKKSLGKCKMELFYCRNIFYNLKEIFEAFGEIECVDSSPQDDV